MSRVLTFVLVAASLFALAFAFQSSRESGFAGSDTTTVRWGPYAVPAGGHDHEDAGTTNNLVAFNVTLPCTDCYITGIVPNLVLADGTTANFATHGMLHHMVLFNAKGQDQTCAGTFIGFLGERIFASGNERSAFTLPPGYGYYVAADAQWTLVIDVMNMWHEPRDMYLEFDFTTAGGDSGLKPVTPVWLDVNNCGSSQFSIPAGYSDTHWDWTSNIEGNIVGMGGHVHDHGISVSAENETSGDLLCTSVAGYAAGSDAAPSGTGVDAEGHPLSANSLEPGNAAYEGHIEEMTRCARAHHISMGDQVRLHTQYYSGEAEDDVMGIMMAYVHETPDMPQMRGDMNCNGGIDSVDGLMVLMEVAHLPHSEMCGAAGGDLDCSGETGAPDALEVLLYVARLPGNIGDGCFPLDAAS